MGFYVFILIIKFTELIWPFANINPKKKQHTKLAETKNINDGWTEKNTSRVSIICTSRLNDHLRFCLS